MSTVESPMLVSSLQPWFGGKRTMAPIIIEELGPHLAYWEPFCGSCAVLMAKEPASMETVNDVHRDLYNQIKCLHPVHGPKIYRRLRRALNSEADFAESREIVVRSDPLPPLDPDRAYHYILAGWQGLREGIMIQLTETKRESELTAIRQAVGLLEDVVSDTDDLTLSEACLRKEIAEKVQAAIGKLTVVK